MKICEHCEQEFADRDIMDCGYCRECCEKDHQGWHCSGCGTPLNEDIAIEGEYCEGCY